jgi:hypothetical protein
VAVDIWSIPPKQQINAQILKQKEGKIKNGKGLFG